MTHPAMARGLRHLGERGYNGAMPLRIRMEAQDLVIVLIDLQDRLAAALEFKVREQLIANVLRLLALSREFKVPVFVTEQYPQGLGRTLNSIINQLPHGVTPIEKMHFSCMAEAPFRQALEATGRKTVVLAGIETHVCVLQSAAHLLEHEYRVFIPTDACASRTRSNWKTGIDMMGQAGAVISSTETMIFQILQKAGTPAFQAMRPHVK
jgi:nicotinamidase-related amidase